MSGWYWWESKLNSIHINGKAMTFYEGEGREKRRQILVEIANSFSFSDAADFWWENCEVLLARLDDDIESTHWVCEDIKKLQ